MTMFSYACDRDRDMVHYCYDGLSNLVFGRDEHDKRFKFNDFLKRNVSYLEVHPKGTVNDFVGEKSSGCCVSNGNLYGIELIGFSGSAPQEYDRIRLVFTHELSHTFCNYLSDYYYKKSPSKEKNGSIKYSHLGKIFERDKKGKNVFYGKMYNETMMDMISVMSIRAQDGKSINNIFNSNYNSWMNVPSGYSMFSSMTRLAVQAFSNNPFVNYDHMLSHNVGIFGAKTIMENSSTKRANDFLYGILYNPRHIEDEFDKVMGKGKYKELSLKLDENFAKCIDNQTISSEFVFEYMNTMADFMNKRITLNIKEGLLNRKVANCLVSNFNVVFNQMQEEYKAYFTLKDIKNIEARANKAKKNIFKNEANK